MSRIRLDRLLVVDFEQTCWDGEPPEGQRSEIIEIGIAEVCLDDEPAVLRTASYLVRPVASDISDYCTNLTGITSTMVRKQGRGLGEILGTIRKNFGGSGKVWAAWGHDNDDIAADCAALGLESPFSREFLNIGQLWSLLVPGNKSVGLAHAVGELGLEFEGPQHRAGPDALAAARVLVTLTEMVRARVRTQPTPSP